MGSARLPLRLADRTIKRALSGLCALSFLLFGQRAFAAPTAVISVPNEENKIALTFDDGPHPYYTEQILDILDEYGIKATFFVVGENVQLYPELVKREIEAGHEVGNHTYSHPHMRNLSEKALSEELQKTEQVLEELCDYRPRLFRPPEGFCCNAVQNCAKTMSYQLLLWDIDTTDWAHNPADNIVKLVLGNAKSGDIILCHDYVTKPSPTPEALRRFIPKLKAKGFEFVTISELMESEAL